MKTNIYEAVEVGNLPYVLKWLAKGGDPNLFDDLNGEPLLVTACRENRTDVVRALLDANADIESCAEDGEGPLEIAVGFGAWECAELLVDRGAETVDAGLSDVMVAAMLGRLDDLRRLLAAGSDPDEITHEGETAATLAIRSRNFEALEMLLTAGADINLAVEDGDTPLFAAISLEDPACVERVIELGADINKSAGFLGDTPLILATRMMVEPVVHKLLSLGADPCKANKDKETPLKIARETEDGSLIALLLDCGATA